MLLPVGENPHKAHIESAEIQWKKSCREVDLQRVPAWQNLFSWYFPFIQSTRRSPETLKTKLSSFSVHFWVTPQELFSDDNPSLVFRLKWARFLTSTVLVSVKVSSNCCAGEKSKSSSLLGLLCKTSFIKNTKPNPACSEECWSRGAPVRKCLKRRSRNYCAQRETNTRVIVFCRKQKVRG